jgi:hypothetical protein
MDKSDTNRGRTIAVGQAAGATNSPEICIVPPIQPQRRVSTVEALEMFRQAGAGTTYDADNFFNQFEYATDLHQGNYGRALNNGLGLLNFLQENAGDIYATIHKGTPFYWLGMAAFQVGDYQTATFFFDAAVSEDIRAGMDPAGTSSPSFRFILIEGDQPAQAARDLVRAMQNRIEAAIADYNNLTGLTGPALELINVRDKFLRPALSNPSWRSFTTALISYFLEWNYRGKLLQLRLGSGTAEPFYVHLFKGCVLFESLLKANPKKQPAVETLGQVLDYLSPELGLTRPIGMGRTTFPVVVRDLVSADDQIQTAVRFAGRIRNTVGHNLGWNAAFSSSQYNRLASMVASSCLHAIACLYR